MSRDTSLQSSHAIQRQRIYYFSFMSLGIFSLEIAVKVVLVDGSPSLYCRIYAAIFVLTCLISILIINYCGKNLDSVTLNIPFHLVFVNAPVVPPFQKRPDKKE